MIGETSAAVSFLDSSLAEGFDMAVRAFFAVSSDWSEKRDLTTRSEGMGLAATAVAGTPGRREEDMGLGGERVK